MSAENGIQQALVLHQRGQLAEAQTIYRSILTRSPDDFDALHLLGLIAYQASEFEEAEVLIGKAIGVNGDNPASHSNRGLALRGLKRFEEALASYARAIAIKPDYAGAYYNRGNLLHELKRFDEALASHDCAIAIRPDHAEAHFSRGNTLHELERFNEALASHDRAIALKPDYAEAYYSRGNALHELGRLDEALGSHDCAIALTPDHAQGFVNRGNTLRELKRFNEAVASYDRAIAIDFGCVEAYSNRGVALHEMERFEEALASYDRAVAIKADYAEAYYNRGNTLQELKRLDAALASHDRAIALRPDFVEAVSKAIKIRELTCDWSRTAKDIAQLRAMVAQDRRLDPFLLRVADASPAEQLRCARRYARDQALPAEAMFSRYRRPDGDIIRIGYLSSDFRDHSVGNLMAELIERHDRRGFSITGYSLGPDDRGLLRERLKSAFDRFVDIGALSDVEAARRIHEDGVDILVDLNGFTRGQRLGILARRPAPVQVNYLSYNGTCGHAFADYLIADPVSVPMDLQEFYAEKIIHLPGCYLPWNTTRKVAGPVLPRRAYGLPDHGFIFSCFSVSYKITAPMFALWMSLLRRVPHSVLWLVADNEGMVANLRRAAAACGVAESRLVFAPNVSFAEYLARFGRADLFLDTTPCSACTVASDSLWAGLPIVTVLGKTFQGRHAASLLRAAGLAELVAESGQAYEALAFRLATEPGLLDAVKDKLRQNRATAVLFDSSAHARHIEAAYRQMQEARLAGRPARPFSVQR